MSWNAPAKLSSYIIFGLIAIGLLAQLLYDPGSILIPLLVLGVIFYLYKFPPGRNRRFGGKPPGSRNKTTERKQSFRVIRGNKNNDEEPPRYH